MKPNFDTIVWLQTAFLGDVILTTAAFRLVRQHFPGVRQMLVTTTVGATALKDHPDLDRVVVFAKRDGFLTTSGAVKKEFADLDPTRTILVQPHRSVRSSLLALRLGFPRVTYFETALSHPAKYRVSRVALHHEAVRIGLLLEPLGVPRSAIVSARPYLTPHDGVEKEWAKPLLNFEGNLIALAPGSVWATKRWEEQGFIELGRRLLGRSDVGLVIMGSGDEKDVTERVASALGSERVWNLGGKTNLDDMRFLYPRFKALVANDSSPLHYASAFDVPTVAIFGATVPEMGFAPLATRRKVVGLDLPCRPCGAHGPSVCPLGHFQCMKGIRVEDVLEEVWSVIAASSS